MHFLHMHGDSTQKRSGPDYAVWRVGPLLPTRRHSWYMHASLLPSMYAAVNTQWDVPPGIIRQKKAYVLLLCLDFGILISSARANTSSRCSQSLRWYTAPLTHCCVSPWQMQVTIAVPELNYPE